MHSEFYMISEEVADKLNKAKANDQRIIAVGTTSIRTLEANMKKYGKFTATSENTDIFIYPGYKFEAIDCLITNFHLPKSTLLMLISAFCFKRTYFQKLIKKLSKKNIVSLALEMPCVSCQRKANEIKLTCFFGISTIRHAECI